jgi:hypothetical protein
MLRRAPATTSAVTAKRKCRFGEVGRVIGSRSPLRMDVGVLKK